jgi:hypothetical protein
MIAIFVENEQQIDEMLRYVNRYRDFYQFVNQCTDVGGDRRIYLFRAAEMSQKIPVVIICADHNSLYETQDFIATQPTHGAFLCLTMKQFQYDRRPFLQFLRRHNDLPKVPQPEDGWV